MATSFENIYSSFLRKIEDKDLPRMSEDEQAEYLRGFLESALGMIEMEGFTTFHDLSDRDMDNEEFSSDLDYGEIEAISLYMVVAWYEPRINSLQFTISMLGSREEKWTDQSTHLRRLHEVQEDCRNRAAKLFRNYRYRHNEYFN